MNLRTPIEAEPISCPVFSEKDSVSFGHLEIKRFMCTFNNIDAGDKEINDFLSENHLYINGFTHNVLNNNIVTCLTFRRVTKTTPKKTDGVTKEQLDIITNRLNSLNW